MSTLRNNRPVHERQRGHRRVPASCGKLAGFPSVFAASAGTAVPGDATDIVRKAIINYEARELKARDYRYVESNYVSHKLLGGKLQDSEVYEVIPLGASLFRRHVAHNGRPLPPLEEMSEQHRLDRAIRQMEESFEKQVEDPHAKIPEDDAPPGTPVSEVAFDAPFESWQLDLQSLPEAFAFRGLGEQVSQGRKLFVVEGKPTGGAAWPRRGALELHNFGIKLWIDQNELEVVKLEARAKKKGLLARPIHAMVNKQKFPGASGETELDSLYESTLWYGPGTMITREWKKVNDETWFPATLHVKGTVSHERDYPNGDHGSATSPMEQHTTYYDY
jgi:hypothetical protein